MKKKICIIAILSLIINSIVWAEPDASEGLESIDIQKIIRYSTKSSLEFTRRGIYHEEKGNYKTAIKDYSRALELTPNRSELLIKRAKCYDELEQYQPAIQDLSEVLAMRPYRAEIYILRGKIYTKMTQYNLAEKDFNKAIELNPLKPDFYIDRGDFFTSLQKKDYANRDYMAASELYAYTASNFKEYKKWQDAIKEYDKAIAIDTQNGEYKQQRQECVEALQEEFRKAQEDAEKRKEKKDKLPKEEFSR